MPEGTVDRILSRFGVMFFADAVAAFAHMGRWLAPDGRIVAVVWGAAHENDWMARPVQAIAEHVDLPTPDPTAPGPFSLGVTLGR